MYNIPPTPHRLLIQSAALPGTSYVRSKSQSLTISQYVVVILLTLYTTALGLALKMMTSPILMSVRLKNEYFFS